MVGPWPLAPHHDHLQYIHHIHLTQRGQKPGHYIPVMKSMEITSHFHSGTGKGCNKPVGC